MQEEQETLETFVARYKLPIILGGISIFCVILSVVLLVKSTQTATPIRFSSDSVASGSSLGASVMAVDVEGAVVRPGLYTVPAGSRVEDAIAAAGGLSRDIDEILFAKTINRAMKLVDGAKILIPTQGENQTSHNLSQPLEAGSQNSALVSVNTASASELDVLPGVGPATAAKIISGRPYQTLDELVAKKAIGASLYDKIKNQLTL